MGLYASLLAQLLRGWLALAYFLQTAVQIRLEVILYTDEALRDFGKFSFIASHLFSAGGRHASSVMELFVPIEILEGSSLSYRGLLNPITFPRNLYLTFKGVLDWT